MLSFENVPQSAMPNQTRPTTDNPKATLLKEVTIMLKKPLSLFIASRLIIAVLIIAIVSFALTQTKTETRILEGTVINKMIGLVTVGSKNQPGQILTLSAGPDTDLIAFHTGDQIIIEYNAAYIIQSITKLG